MKIYRFKYNAKTYHGVLKEESLFPVKGSIFKNFKTEDEGIPISEVTVLPPVEPSKIVAVGLNYSNHAMERGKKVPGEPLIFLKPSSAVIGHRDIIIFPKMAKRVDYEGELAFIIKNKAHDIKENESVERYVLGYSCFNDITARDLQEKDGQFTRSKSFDTFAAVGPCLSTDVDPSQVRLKTFLNGKLKQSASAKNLIFSVPYLLKFVSQIMTLYPGDIVTTGTPAGVGPMYPGDKVDVQIEGIGTLSNTVMKIKA